eukprot:CAMPEP_0183373626 /NCGR_PEP_ID=MMETSP0164_2-20130417/111968_1 /TAXON_ID=221442 /ORGANISM="Coccolithus pelagicus ssp braarudi, Strain PLY182g" /LENGTH=349 /DNA_ID=CAMNT_0025550543 /DNA_START=27 /DNA_END=1073 /DNA_ORIENTATION=+
MPTAVKADHTIATPRSSELACRTTDKFNPIFAGPAELSKTRKTPSPTAKPPSPTVARLKTPSPTIAPVRALPERKSPSGSSQRLSPTSAKGGASPTDLSTRSTRPDGKAVRKGNSPDAAVQFLSSVPPAQPPRHKVFDTAHRLHRSKSSMSYPEAYAQRTQRRGARAAHTPEAATGWENAVQTERVRPEVEMRDSSTQTVCNAGTQKWLGEEMPDQVGREILASSSEQWLEEQIRIQGELAMAISSGMEQLVDNSNSRAFASTSRELASQHNFGRFLTTRPLGEGSDGEECDEVRSLLSGEEGPVLAKYSHGRGAAGAPDPVAMLSDGQRKAIDASSDEADLGALDSDR